MPESIILPTIFNVDNNVAEPDIIALFNVILLAVTFPDTFNELLIVDELETNKLVKLVLLNNVPLVVCKFDIFKFE